MRVTIQKLHQYKEEGHPIVVLTAADYAIAKLLDRAQVDMILVGDSLGMAVLGHENTLPVTLDEMIHHAKAVCRGVERSLVVVDLPFMSYQESPEQALRSAGRVLKETGAQAVKLEGGNPTIAETVIRLVQAGIPVMGHVGLTPQSVHQMGYRQQGNSPATSGKIFADAMTLQEAGAFAVILEHIPGELAARITQKMNVPTIGIGAGSKCDGQVLVTHDLLGLSDRQPPFARVYVNLQEVILDALKAFSEDVRSHRFPKS